MNYLTSKLHIWLFSHIIQKEISKIKLKSKTLFSIQMHMFQETQLWHHTNESGIKDYKWITHLKSWIKSWNILRTNYSQNSSFNYTTIETHSLHVPSFPTMVNTHQNWGFRVIIHIFIQENFFWLIKNSW